ncbi:DUF1840 domain-containing protein [Inhella proteolytica]|uniref:DUF1840 domain-containing protein n=1 Tax=Inhella proteolytica TaxID=2795029 RepID=A0A931J801_9BURK|nr:DUF1840 domain-containing protein [Inhella proteolytica]MBH9579463.1 DUF1840 domain-containing protein [Inhella proteolytica]
MLRFHSKAGADVLMLGAHADLVLRALGREPAPQGIFLPEQIAAALHRLDRAEQLPVSLPVPGAEPDEGEANDGLPDPQLRQRAWPLRELLQRAAHKDCPVLWETL